MSASALVLAGGRSRRLGADKRRLRLASGRGLLEATIQSVAALADEVLVALGDDVANFAELASEGVRLIGDAPAGSGPLGGLVAGLAAARNDLVVAVACDLPYLNPELLRWLLSLAPGNDLVVPRRADGTLEMLHAVYRRNCLAVARSRVLAGQLRLSGLAADLLMAGQPVRFVDEVDLRARDPDLKSFLNLNTPEDLRYLTPS